MPTEDTTPSSRSSRDDEKTVFLPPPRNSDPEPQVEEQPASDDAGLEATVAHEPLLPTLRSEDASIHDTLPAETPSASAPPPETGGRARAEGGAGATLPVSGPIDATVPAATSVEQTLPAGDRVSGAAPAGHDLGETYSPEATVPMAARSAASGGGASASSDTQEMESTVPQVRGYRLLERLGKGTFGSVWLGKNLRTGAEVAVKLFNHHIGADWEYLRREIECLLNVAKHPHVVTLLDADFTHKPPFYTMELMAGSLEGEIKKIRERKLGSPKTVEEEIAWVHWDDMERASRWFEEMARGLAYVHGKGFLHCDLKPANVLLDDEDHVRIVDFGQALMRGRDRISMGTLFFMPPEQTEAVDKGSRTHPDVQWDIYALGATMYTLLTGRPPRAGKEQLRSISTANTVIERLQIYRKLLLETPLTPILEVNPKVPPDLARIVEKCLEPSPAERYTSIAEVLDDLQRMRQKQPLLCRKPWERSYLIQCFVRRNALWLIPVFAMIAVLIITQVQLARKAFKKRMAVFTVMHRDGSETVTEVHSNESRFEIEKQTAVTLYQDLITKAHAALQAGNTGDAQKFLESCSPPARGWEWGRLSFLARRAPEGQPLPADLGVERVTGLPPTAGYVDITPNGFLFVVNRSLGQAEVVQSTGQVDTEFQDTDGRPFRSIALGLDGKTAAFLRANGEILVRKPSLTEEAAKVIGVHPDARAVALQSNMRRVFSIGADGVLKSWTVDYPTELISFPTGIHDAVAMRFSLEGNRLILFDSKNDAYLLQAAAWRPAEEF